MRMLSAAAAALNMTVEAYVAMRNRKIGVTALQPWQPPPFPLVVEADGKELVIQEHVRPRARKAIVCVVLPTCLWPSCFWFLIE